MGRYSLDMQHKDTDHGDGTMAHRLVVGDLVEVKADSVGPPAGAMGEVTNVKRVWPSKVTDDDSLTVEFHNGDSADFKRRYLQSVCF